MLARIKLIAATIVSALIGALYVMFRIERGKREDAERELKSEKEKVSQQDVSIEAQRKRDEINKVIANAGRDEVDSRLHDYYRDLIHPEL